jgi:hypothetical protein
MVKQRYVLILLLCLSLTAMWGQNADSLSLPLPQFLNPFYDSFARNYIGASAAGRGYTGAAYLGDVSGVNLNPASLLPDSCSLSVEVDLKPPVEAEGYPSYANYSSRIPIGMVALNGKLSDNISAGLVYSMPKSIYLDDFSVIINQGAGIVQRFPSYYQVQLTANAAYHKAPWHLGLNLHNQLHLIDDPIFLHTFERIRSYRYALRFQPGIIYAGNKLSAGISAMPPSKFTWDLTFAEYDVLQPWWINGGISIADGKARYLVDAEFEQFSEVSTEFKDRLIVKAGYEIDLGRFIYRLGYLYTPEVYSGVIRLPSNPNASTSSSFWWGTVPGNLMIESNEQHFVSGGFSYFHKHGAVNMSVMQVIAGEVKQFQFDLSLSFYLSSLRRKGFLNFDA